MITLLLPSHTTGHAGPHPAIQKVEVPRTSRPERSGFFFASRAYPTSPPRWASPAGFRRELRLSLRGHLWSTTEIRNLLSPFRSVLHDWGGPPARSPSLLRPLLTSRSAVNCSPRRHPFGHEARSPQVRFIDCPCTSAGFT